MGVKNFLHFFPACYALFCCLKFSYFVHLISGTSFSRGENTNFLNKYIDLLNKCGICFLCLQYVVWNVLWLGWNIFVICLYLEVGVLNRVSISDLVFNSAEYVSNKLKLN